MTQIERPQLRMTIHKNFSSRLPNYFREDLYAMLQTSLENQYPAMEAYDNRIRDCVFECIVNKRLRSSEDPHSWIYVEVFDQHTGEFLETLEIEGYVEV